MTKRKALIVLCVLPFLPLIVVTPAQRNFSDRLTQLEKEQAVNAHSAAITAKEDLPNRMTRVEVTVHDIKGIGIWLLGIAGTILTSVLTFAFVAMRSLVRVRRTLHNHSSYLSKYEKYYEEINQEINVVEKQIVQLPCMHQNFSNGGIKPRNCSMGGV
jgi:hypothetical protein